VAMHSASSPETTEVRRSSVILRQIRTDIFGETQEVFGKKFQVKGGSISRIENETSGYRVSKKYLRDLRQVRAPRDRGEPFQSLLAELEVALSLEAGETVQARGLWLGRQAEEAARKAQESARQAQEAARLVQEAEGLQAALHLETQFADEAARRLGDTVRAADTRLTERAEHLRLEEDSRRAHDAKARERTVQQLEAGVSQAEEVLKTARGYVETAFTHLKSLALEAEQRFERWADGERQRLKDWAHAELSEVMRSLKERATRELEALLSRHVQQSKGWTVVASVAGGVALVGAVVAVVAASVVWTTVQRFEAQHSLARHEDVRPADSKRGSGEPAASSTPAETEVPSAGLDGGTVLAELLTHALPLPAHGVPGQLPAPCPRSTEERSGYCWGRHVLTAEEVKDGACEHLQLYEPSPGWCHAHLMGYHPFLGTHKKNNVVEPQ